MNEPARLVALLTAAAAATVNLLGLLFDWSGDVIAGVNLAIAAWILVGGEIVRSKVTPNGNVALTVKQLDALTPPGGDKP